MVTLDTAAPRPRSRPRLTPLLLFVLAVLTSAYVWWAVAFPVLSGRLGEHATHGAPLYLHTIGGTLMLTAGSVAIFIGWTRRAFRFHRTIGYAYLAGGLAASLAAIGMNIANPHEDVGIALATGVLATVWILAAAMGWRAIRNRRIEIHREWMIRSYVLTWTFVLCRLVQRPEMSAAVGGLSTADVIWVSWILPLVVCEIVLQWKKGAPAVRKSAAT